MPRCFYCDAELPGAERICKDCFEVHIAANKNPPRKGAAELLRTAPLTWSLIFANIIVFILMLSSWKSILGPSDQTLISWGADYGPLTLNGQYWRLISAMFVHFDVGHIFFNMLCLANLGIICEEAFGSITLAIIYFGAGLCGNVLSECLHPLDISMGASGAIFGMIGLLLPPLSTGKLVISSNVLHRPLVSLVLFCGFNLFYGMLHPEINNAAHIGGLCCGIISGIVVSLRAME